MSSKSLRLAILAAVAALSCGAFAADNKNMAVSASVNGVCKLTLVPAMNFGALDPSSTTDATKSVDVEYKCTKGTAPSSFAVGTVTNGATGFTGSLAGATAPADSIAYTIKWTAPTAAGTGFGTGSTATPVTLNGTIPYANFQNAKADSYAQTVAIEINN